MNELLADAKLPRNQMFIGGAWCDSSDGRSMPTFNPGTGEKIADVPVASAPDVDRAVEQARDAFLVWRNVPIAERAKSLRAIADVIRKNARELAYVDALNCGNPVTRMIGDAGTAAAQLDYFASLATEMKGETLPPDVGGMNFSVRQPLGVVVRIHAFNHPFMFCAGKMAAPLAAGNTLIAKPADQAPLSTLLLAELCKDLLPPGVFNVVTGGREVGAALASHPGVAKVGLIGSVAAGRAVMRAASDTLKPVILELGGKNALIAFADADPKAVADAMVRGMNFTWCGQSCGSTSRALIHEAIYDEVISHLSGFVAEYKPGLPTDPKTTMGALISRDQRDRVMSYIVSAKGAGARLICGGGIPSDDTLAGGHYVEPTIFADVTTDMRVAREEIFGPVLSILKWNDERQMIADVNALEYGLTCSIWTDNLQSAHRTALAVEAGYVWINEVSKHFLGSPFGGVKQSGLGREECLDELLGFTTQKSIHVKF